MGGSRPEVGVREVPGRAAAVVVGGGIVGSSLAHHLVRLGWGEVVLIDKGSFPRPGGSTGHASNFLFPVDHSKEMTRFTQESIRQYGRRGVFTECGGIEVARTEERMEELRRRMASAAAWGEPAELIDPERVHELIPYVKPDILLGGFYCPGVGVVDSVRAAELLRAEAEAEGALRTIGETEVLGFDVEGGRVQAVRTDRGTWPRSAAASGARGWPRWPAPRSP
jgi:glycine/D-amino acid oxidase-like deaminating enzyme